MMASKLLARSAVIPAAFMSLAFSLTLFGVMFSVINAGHVMMEELEVLPTIDFVRLKRDSSVETISRNKPPPPPPAPPPPKKMKVASVAPINTLSGMDMPSLDLNANLGGQALKGNKAAMFDGDIIPLQCPPVSYPSDARRAGLSGWVVIEFVVGPDGSVRSAKAVEANPRGIFEAAAVMAARKCKFKPKMADGKAVEQSGRRKWNFELNKSAG